MRLPAPLADWRAWAASLSRVLAQYWGVEHKSDGRHEWSWTDITYNAGRFKGNSSTWTVDAADVIEYRYGVLGNCMVLQFRILSTDVGSGNGFLLLDLPAGYRSTGWAYGPLSYVDAGGTADVGIVISDPDDATYARQVRLYTRTAANWTATTSDNTTVQGSILVQVIKD